MKDAQGYDILKQVLGKVKDIRLKRQMKGLIHEG